jgi:hypothetical protein
VLRRIKREYCKNLLIYPYRLFKIPSIVLYLSILAIDSGLVNFFLSLDSLKKMSKIHKQN